MKTGYAKYLLPALGGACVIGLVSVIWAMRPPLPMERSEEAEASYRPRIPERLKLEKYVPTMEEVVEKHLFVKERKATGANAFPDLLVKGVYIGEQRSAVFSLKSRPEANLRVWQGDVDAAMALVKEDRDIRRPIVDFLGEWEVKEITFEGVKVEHIITGEVETYAVDYTPVKKVKDSAEAGYGQGMLAQTGQGGGQAVARGSSAGGRQVQPGTSGAFFGQLRTMMQQMTPEQRERFAERIRGGGRDGAQNSQTDKKNTKSSSKTSSNKSSGSKNSGGGGSSRGR